VKQDEIRANFGVPRDLFATFKWLIFYLPDLIILLVGGFTGGAFLSFFPVSQLMNMILFVILVWGLSIFLIVQTNGGKRNYEIIFFYLRRKTSPQKKKVKMSTMHLGERNLSKNSTIKGKEKKHHAT
jgi:hypothetical protein